MNHAEGAPVVVIAALHFEKGPEAVPLGAACIVSALRERFGEKISVSLREGFASEGSALLVEKISAACPDAAGFSLYSWNRSICVAAAKEIRKRFPGIFLFCGGPEASALPAGLLLKEGGPFDAVVEGEGERKVLSLVEERFFPGKELSPRAPLPLTKSLPYGDSLESLPSPWLDGTLKIGESSTVLWELTRGCPYACAYCYESRGDRRLRHFGEERLLEELKVFVRANVPYVFVLDPTFNIENKRALKILDMILAESRKAEEEGLRADTHWHFEVRAELVGRAQARRFAGLGASLQIGLQTADSSISAHLGRVLDRKAFRRGIDILNAEGVVFGLDLIYGLPGDSLASYKRSLDFALSLYPNNLDLFRLSVLPGTALRDWSGQLGMEIEEEAPYMVLGTGTFSAGDLEKAESLSGGTDIFYNRGRAVPWFLQALKPLKMKPSVFLETFTEFLLSRSGKPEDMNSIQIEELQLSWLETCYRKSGKDILFPALRDIIRCHGALSRALAEGLSTVLDLEYDPDELLKAGDPEIFVPALKKKKRRVRIFPGPRGPEIR